MKKQSVMSVDPDMLKTEERIIVAAIRVFSDCPVEVTSTRTIAKAAGVSLSAIPYYFKTKEKLYEATINRMVDFVEEGAKQTFADLPPIESLSKDEAKAVLQRLIELKVEMFCGSPSAVTFAKIIMREHLSPSPVYDVIYQRFLKGVFNNVIRLIQRISPQTSDKDAMMKIVWSVGQVAGFRVGREMFKRHVEDFVGYSPKEIADIKALIIRNVFRELEQE